VEALCCNPDEIVFYLFISFHVSVSLSRSLFAVLPYCHRIGYNEIALSDCSKYKTGNHHEIPGLQAS